MEKLDEDYAEAIETIEDEVLDALALSRPRDDDIDARIERLKKSHGENFYATVLRSLVGVRMEEREAKETWEKILAHKYALSKRLSRDVGVTVAALDFFKNVRRDIEEARIVPASSLVRTVRLSLTDGLTGLYNHRAFQEEFTRFLRRGEKRGTPFAFVLFDLDDFKAYNDQNGHLAGDLLLFEVARILYTETREGVDVPARYGGEEFAVLLRDAGPKEAADTAERIRASVERETLPGEGGQPGGRLTISGGVAVYPQDGATKNDLIAAADARLYEAKAAGKNRVIGAGGGVGAR